MVGVWGRQKVAVVRSVAVWGEWKVAIISPVAVRARWNVADAPSIVAQQTHEHHVHELLLFARFFTHKCHLLLMKLCLYSPLLCLRSPLLRFKSPPLCGSLCIRSPLLHCKSTLLWYHSEVMLPLLQVHSCLLLHLFSIHVILKHHHTNHFSEWVIIPTINTIRWRLMGDPQWLGHRATFHLLPTCWHIGWWCTWQPLSFTIVWQSTARCCAVVSHSGLRACSSTSSATLLSSLVMKLYPLLPFTMVTWNG